VRSLFAGCLCLRLAWLSLGSFTESVAEAATDDLEVTATASSCGLSSLGLDGPVV
jgi:hypothetical protein